MSKYDEQFKLKVVKQYLASQGGFKRVAQQHDLDYAMVRRWVCTYRLHGKKGLSKKSTHYSAQFKLSVLQHMWRTKLSFNQTAAVFDIRSWASVGIWERQYHSGGLNALAPRPRGRVKKMPQSPPSKPVELTTDDQRTREQLLKENEYLRAELAYLKKLDALIQAEKRKAPLKKHK